MKITVLICVKYGWFEEAKINCHRFNFKSWGVSQMLKIACQLQSESRRQDDFQEEFWQWDNNLLKQKHKTVLLVHNCTVHPYLENLKCIELFNAIYY